MRVLKVTQTYYPFLETGGPPVKVRALARALGKRGHHVSVVTADLGLTEEKAKAAGCVRSQWGWQGSADGLEAVYLRSLVSFRRLTVNPVAKRFFQQAMGECDVVHIYGLYDLLGPAAGQAARVAGVPYVLEPLGMTRPIDRSFRRKRLWHRWYGKKLFEGAAIIIATSEIEQQDLAEAGYGNGKVRLRFNGVDPTEFAAMPPRGNFRAKWKIENEAPVILFLSRIIPRKGADLLIESFAEMNGSGERLVIAGPEGEPGTVGQLKELARKRGVAERVVFTGPLYEKEKAEALADADVFALPSSYENFANAAAEAVACGVPVIVTDRCGIGPLVDGKAGVVIRRNQPELTRALRNLIEDDGLRARLRAGCSDVARALAWDKLAEEMERHYSEVMAEQTSEAKTRTRGDSSAAVGAHA